SGSRGTATETKAESSSGTVFAAWSAARASAIHARDVAAKTPAISACLSGKWWVSTPVVNPPSREMSRRVVASSPSRMITRLAAAAISSNRRPERAPGDMLSFVDTVPALLLYCGDHNRCDGGHGVDYGLTGTVAIVGGSSSGMGRATARALAGEGCRVVLYARRGELLSEVAGQIAAETGSETLAAPANATDHASLEMVVERALERFGRLDILVNNAGGPPAGDYESFSDADWQAAYELT